MATGAKTLSATEACDGSGAPELNSVAEKAAARWHTALEG